MSRLAIFWAALGILIFTLALAPVATTLAAGQDGAIDPTFKSSAGPNNEVLEIVPQFDGKILIGGKFTTYDNLSRNNIARVNADGSIDPTFNPGTGANSDVYEIIPLAGGKILIGGQFTEYNGVSRNRIARLNADGSLDTTFNPGSGANLNVLGMAVQLDGKILVGGNFSSFNGTAYKYLVRLLPDGTVDTTFNSGGAGPGTDVYSIIPLSSGKIIIAGNFTTYNFTTRNRVARLNSDGSVDTTFNPLNGANNRVNLAVLQSDSKILLGGFFTTYNGSNRSRIVRITADGNLDTTFNPGTGANGDVYGIALQSNGRILISGDFNSFNGVLASRIARLNSDGSVDTTFNSEAGADSFTDIVSLQNDGKILIGGRFSSYNGTGRNRIARLNSSGSLDTSFATDNSVNSNVLSMAVQNDSKIVIGGSFNAYNGIARNQIARLNADGSLDTTFDVGSGANDVVYSVVLQSDGKILIGGSFTTYNGIARSRIARLNADGTLDTTFVVGNGFTTVCCAPAPVIYDMALQGDGKIMVSGFFDTYNGVARRNLARLNSDGSPDTTFSVGGANDWAIHSMAIQSDGKILIGGVFTQYGGITRNRIARVNTNGSLDTSFNPGTGASWTVFSIAIQNDGKIIIGGNFGTYNGVARSGLARLNSDGSLDTTFLVNEGANEEVFDIIIQSDSKILIGGKFTSYNGVGRMRTARLNSDGSLDTNFNPGGGANDKISSLALQGNSKLLIGGYFTAVDTYTRNYIARLETIVKSPSSVALISSPNFSQFGQSVTFTATTSPLTATGTIQFTFGSTSVTTTLANGVATYVTSTLPIGDTSVVANYSGDSLLLPASSVVYTQTVTKIATSVSLTSSDNPAIAGTNLTFTATVAPPTASGLVTFTFNGVAVASSPLVNGLATYMTNTLPGGTYTVTATYSGDATYAPGSSVVYTQTVSKAASSVSLISSPNAAIEGTTVHFTATLSPIAASGSVTFTFNGVTATTSPLVNGAASYMTNTLPTGTYTVTATYSGNATYATSSSVVYTQVIVAACNLQLVTSPTDDGQASTCGTLSYALATTASGTISFALSSGNLLTFTGSLTPTLAAGVLLDGGATGIVLNGNGVAGDGLRLGGGNLLSNLTISGFGGREIVAAGGAASANKFYKVKVSS